MFTCAASLAATAVARAAFANSVARFHFSTNRCSVGTSVSAPAASPP
jgi:hypothetical protein